RVSQARGSISKEATVRKAGRPFAPVTEENPSLSPPGPAKTSITGTVMFLPSSWSEQRLLSAPTLDTAVNSVSHPWTFRAEALPPTPRFEPAPNTDLAWARDFRRRTSAPGE